MRRLRLCVFGRDQGIERQHVCERLTDQQLSAGLWQSSEQAFRRNISNQRILCERASAKAADGRIETAATCIVSSKYFWCGFAGHTVKMHADVAVGVLADRGIKHTPNQIRTGHPNSVSE